MRLLHFIKKDLPIYLGIASTIISIAAASGTIYLGIFQIPAIKQQQNLAVADMIWRYNQMFAEEPNRSIMLLVINTQNPILKNHGGKFDSTDLDGFLSVFNTISDLYDNDLMPVNLIYNEYSDIILRSSKNQEIQQYISNKRLENEDYFQGFDELVTIVKDYESS